ncbi:hypothetical protein BC332_21130 [Capsicum chinense]|nr:hypothetical protein BC332_21130 [Capsicum chinense]
MAFEIGGDGVLRYQGRLCFPDIDGLRERILDEVQESCYIGKSVVLPDLVTSLLRQYAKRLRHSRLHTRKKRTPEDPDVWVEPRALLTYNFCQTLPEDRRDLPLSQEKNERIWLDAVGGLSRYVYAYGLPQRTFREFHSELEDLGSFQDDELTETILALKQQITKLSSEAKVSQAGERQIDIQYARMKAQFDALLASRGGGVPPCFGDVVRPSRPPQSLPISHGVYGQYRDVTEEPDSDKDDEDYYVDNTPSYLLKLNVV